MIRPPPDEADEIYDLDPLDLLSDSADVEAHRPTQPAPRTVDPVELVLVERAEIERLWRIEAVARRLVALIR